MSEEPKPTGRPSGFTQELADTICLRMAEGESLRQICRDDEMPSMSMVMRWLRAHESFREHYAQAREDLLEHWAEETNEIADDSSNDWIDREVGKDRIERVLDHEHVSRSKLRIDTRKWLLSKLKPRVYGDRTEITGKDGKDLIPEATDAEIARRLSFLLVRGVAATEADKP